MTTSDHYAVGKNAAATDETGGETERVALAEEVLEVSKREVITGRVRVRTRTKTTEEMVREELDTAHVSVTRGPVNRIVDKPASARTEGEVTIVPVFEEVLVVETKLLLKEEIYIRHTHSKETVEERIPLRKQTAVIEELPNKGES